MEVKAVKYEKPEVETIEIILKDIITLSLEDFDPDEGSFGDLV